MNQRIFARVCLVLSLALLTGLKASPAGNPPGDTPPDTARATPAAAQPIDAGYTAKIREYTTEPFLTTELVDHLPASATVPTPEKVIGYVVGTPNKLTHVADLHRYYLALEKATPRVRVFKMGKSEEGREFMVIAVSDEANLARLDRYKEITAQLADPRSITEADAARLEQEGKPFYWLSGSIHSPETGSPEMLMELAYRLAVEDSALVQNIRKNLIVLITPVLEVDGRDREVDLYNYQKAHPGKPAPSLVYWGHYVAHDNNRDAIAMGLALSNIQMKTFFTYHPQVLHDLHESVPFLYTSTGTGPYNAWLDPIVVSEWQELAYYEIEKMTERGVPGVWTHGFYDGWAPNYMFFVAQGHNGIGRFYETFGGRGADTGVRTVGPEDTTRTWFRPNPPLPKVNWSIRDNINLQQSALLFALDYTAQHATEFLARFYDKSRRSVAKATTEGPAAWVIVNDGRRPALAAQLAELLQRQGAEVQRLDREFSVKVAAKPEARPDTHPDAHADSRPAAKAGEVPPAKPDAAANKEQAAKPKTEETTIPAGSYVIRMDQPFSRVADMLLDTQFYSTSDPRPYDDTGWTLGPLRNVKTMRVTDISILRAPMSLLTGPAHATGELAGPSAAAKFFLVDANAEPGLATLRFRLGAAKIFAAEDAFEADGQKYHAGTFLIPVENSDAGLRSQLEAAAKDLGLRLRATNTDLSVARHPLALPRVALLHTWVNTQTEGWFRLMLEENKIPYTYISDQVVRATADLREKYDVILFPPASGDLARLIEGVPKRTLPDGSDPSGPVPWKKSDLTPSFGLGPDQTDDIRGGLGLEGLANLKKFVEQGGLFIAVGPSTNLPIQLGFAEGVSVDQTRQLQARGAIFNATVEDKASPIVYGYDDRVAVYFNQAPVFRVSLAGGFGGSETVGRLSGRGSATDPDIPQGRPWNPPVAEPHRTRAQQEVYVAPELREYLQAILPPPELWPRVVLRFAPEKDLWVNGMLAGGSELGESPAIIDSPLGRGHVVLFAINPMWRMETQGSFMFVLNAVINFDHLNAGRKIAAPDKTAGDP